MTYGDGGPDYEISASGPPSP